jgi:hypothetical protein
MRIQMKKSLQIMMSILMLSMVLCVAPPVLAQNGPVVGGYAETSSSDAEVLKAASYAVRAQGQKQGVRISLISIQRAEVQVVAGLNYRLALRVKVGGKPRDVTAVVYRNLKRKYSLSSWDVAGNTAGSAAALSNSTIEGTVKALAEAYTAKALGRLDNLSPFLGTVRIIIEHSLADDNARDRFETKQFATLERAEQWLRSREHDEGLPARESRPLVQCKGGVCTYDFDGGILHNHLYLQKISYGYRKGRPYIKTIYLLDGD